MCKNKNQRTLIDVSRVALTFSDGSEITFDHDQDCCECNYADFEQVEDMVGTVYKGDMKFESCEWGFRFGTAPGNMTFVPCYSEQNGYYTSEVDIYYNGELVVETSGEYVNNE